MPIYRGSTIGQRLEMIYLIPSRPRRRKVTIMLSTPSRLPVISLNPQHWDW